ncbi:helix-turn-helix domain-containing protein [Nonomuraea fuscirosea]|uniref:helix-turn-helix domain-containing protein n=1 Tax=Nonomuraea fuscirosea TaxID=1291556 RepID=UPI0037BDDF60
MSVEAMSWALNHAPVDETSAAFVLVGLANHAGPDGRGAFPSVARLMSYTQLGERTVREQLDILEAAAIISPCDPEIVAAYIKRGDKRPQGWDIDMTLHRENPEHLARFQAAVAAVKAERKARRERLAVKRQQEASTSSNTDEVQPSHPAADARNEVRRSHPEQERGATVAGSGVRPSPDRGATVAPEPYIEPSFEPSFQEMPPSSASPEGEAKQEDLLGDDMPAAESSKKKPRTRKTKERSPEEQLRFEQATKVAQWWWDQCDEAGVPKIGRSANGTGFPGLVKMLETALADNYTQREIADALRSKRKRFPALGLFENALMEVRGIAPVRTLNRSHTPGNHLAPYDPDDAANEQNRQAWG